MSVHNGVLHAGYLLCAQAVAGPFLIVVPLSTVPNWIREFRRWLPQCNALVYVGDSTSRRVSSIAVALDSFKHIGVIWSAIFVAPYMHPGASIQLGCQLESWGYLGLLCACMPT